MGSCQCNNGCQENRIGQDELPIQTENIYVPEGSPKPIQYNTVPDLQNGSQDFKNCKKKIIKISPTLNESRNKQSQSIVKNSIAMNIKGSEVQGSFDMTKGVCFSNDGPTQKQNIVLDDKLNDMFGAIINKQSNSEKNIEIYENDIDKQLLVDQIENCNNIIKQAQQKRSSISQKKSQYGRDSKKRLSQNLNQRLENDKFLEQEILCQLDNLNKPTTIENSNQRSSQLIGMQDHYPHINIATKFKGNLDDLMSQEAIKALQKLPVFEVGILPTDSVTLHTYFQFNDTKDVYIGQWRKGNMNGHGKLYFKNGGVYEGNFYENQRTGEGRIVQSNGDLYVGGFLNGEFSQQGNFTLKNGEKYTGQFLNGKKHGKGKFEGKTEVFQGQYADNQRDGYGELLVKEIYSYKGEFKNNKINGKGVCEWINKKSYDGNWVDNNMSGYGVMIWNNGKQYKGGFSNSQFNGKGEFKQQDGSIIQGEWILGKRQGKGLMIDSKGIKYEVLFKNDQEISKKQIS